MKYMTEDLIIFEYKLFKKFSMFFAYSKYYLYREEVALQGYHLDILVNDPEWSVRGQVARRGYRLDILVNDPEPVIRCQVAKHGYGLDILINDPDPDVRERAERKLREKQNEIQKQ